MWVTWSARKNCLKIKERLEGSKRSCHQAFSKKQVVESNNRGPIRNQGVARVTTQKCRALWGSSAAGASNTSEFQLSILPSVSLLP
jgi:hypothetical protein